MNGNVCCLLGVCCPAGSDEQRTTLAEALFAEVGCSERDARLVASWVLSHFDLAPAGSLAAYRDAIVKMAIAPR